jgi:hypothetical protein
LEQINMTNQEAKSILALYRPGSADRNDPAFTQALALVEAPRLPGAAPAHSDAELARWFQDHCAAYLSMHAKFLAIQPPPAFKDQILAEYKVQSLPYRPARSLMRVAAAALAALALTALISLLFWSHLRNDAFPAYLNRLARTALRPNYGMELETADLDAVNAFLLQRHAPAPSGLPPGLKSAPLVGCAVTTWQGKPVAMLCFQSGRPLGPGEKADLWLFVAQQETVSDAPGGAARYDAKVNKLITTAWSENGKIYVLATVGDKGELDKYF